MTNPPNAPSSPSAPLTPEQKLARVKAWQTAGFVHELTCGNDSGHPPLVPKLEGDVVVCECPFEGCGFRQLEGNLPQVVFSDHVAKIQEEIGRSPTHGMAHQCHSSSDLNHAGKRRPPVQ
jgi:hypothetical protein